MALLGEAAVVIWNDLASGSRAAFLGWHNHEHIPERVRIHGFQRGRRGRATGAGPEFLTLYEVADLGVLRSDRYLERLNSPSPSTQRMLPYFRNTARSLCRVEVSVGGGVGGFLYTVRSPGELQRDREALRGFRAFAADVIGKSTDVIGAHLLARDIESSQKEMAESRLRAGRVAIPATILIVEGITEESLAGAAKNLTDELHRTGLSKMHDALTAGYRHELCLTAAELAAF